MAEQLFENDEMKEIINDFIVESGELVESAMQDIITIEEKQDDEIINSIFRAVHTIKGTSSFLGFDSLSKLAHKTEDLLGMIRKGEISINRNITDVLIESLDIIKTMIENIGNNGFDKGDTSLIITKLESFIKNEAELTGVEDIKNSLPDKNRADIIQEAIHVEKTDIPEKSSEARTRNNIQAKSDQTVRIDVKKLDELMDLVGELVLGKNRLISLNNNIKKNNDRNFCIEDLEDVTNYIESITNDLQLSVMKARLVPVGKLFKKLPRMVRDLCKEFNKNILLKINGEETELDRSLIELLHDPLIHIIRNSVDHGIETPEARHYGGKEEKGLLSISAYNENNHVIIEIFDDGKGIDLKSIKDKVREKGIITETELNNLSDTDIMNLVFIPGLSTAKKLSSISGRGVGMDVVKTNIEKMNGQVHINSEQGKWTNLTIKLPLTLAIMRALIVNISHELYAIPLNNVIELVKNRTGLTKSIDKREVLVLRDEIIPIVDMSKVFMSPINMNNCNYLVICKIGDKTIGVKVNSVLGQEEIVIKPLGELMGNINGIGGTTIRGDGKIVLILDVSSIINKYY